MGVFMKGLFLKLKPCAILLLLKDTQQEWYPSKLARSSNTSYVHTVNLLSKLSKMGAVTSEKKGKQNVFRLTEKGAYIALVLDDFAKKCDALEQESKPPPKEKTPAEIPLPPPPTETQAQKQDKPQATEKEKA